MKPLSLAAALVIMSVCSLARPGSAQNFPGFQGAQPKGNAPEFSPLETRLIGQKHWLRGASAGVRLIVTDHRTGRPVPARVDISVTAQTDGVNKGVQTRLFAGRTGPNGTVDTPLSTRGLESGTYI